MSETPAANTAWIYVELIDLPSDARVHIPEDIQDMANDLKDNGQIQNIVVQRKGDRYEVIAGARRTKAAALAGWKQIRAEIREKVSEFLRLDIMFSENEGRVEANPLFQAQLLDNMLKADPNMTQTALAEKKGKSQAWMSEYLSFLDIPEEAKAIFNALKISHRGLRAVANLGIQSLQIQLAQDVKSGKLKPEDVEKRANQLAKEAKSGQEGQKPKKIADDSGLSFKRKGADILIKAQFPEADGIGNFLGKLGNAYMAWAEAHTASKSALKKNSEPAEPVKA